MKRPVKKRNIFATIALALALVFGRPRLNFSRFSSSIFDNQTVTERVLPDQKVDYII